MLMFGAWPPAHLGDPNPDDGVALAEGFPTTPEHLPGKGVAAAAYRISLREVGSPAGFEPAAR